jgi:phage terminase small subunit
MEPKKTGRGGARPGAGRKPAAKVVIKIAPPEKIAKAQESSAIDDGPVSPVVDVPAPLVDALSHRDPKVFLLALMNDQEADVKLRSDAAKALMPFMHARVGESGKKDQKADEAKKAQAGKFAPSAPPKLVAAGGRKV